MRKIAEFEFKVQPMDVDFSESIRLTQMIGYLFHTAGLNADENGFGIQALHAQDRAWVASRLALEMYRYPKSDELFRIETWIENFGRVFTTRNFKVTDTSGIVIGAGTCVWCMIDMSERKAVDLGSLDYTGFATGIPSLIFKPVKIPVLTNEPISRHRVKYSDIDFNRHTNSMKYIEWMTDLFPLELFLTREVRRIDINYVNEVLFGETVDIFRQQDEPDNCLFEMRRDVDVICRAMMQFDDVFDLRAYK